MEYSVEELEVLSKKCKDYNASAQEPYLFTFNDHTCFMDIGLTYQTTGNFALRVMCLDEEDFVENYGTFTVNIDALEPFEAAIDVNMFPHLGEWLEEHDLASPSNRITQPIHSGFVDYPVYEFKLATLTKYDPEGFYSYYKEVLPEIKALISENRPASHPAPTVNATRGPVERDVSEQLTDAQRTAKEQTRSVNDPSRTQTR